MTIFFNYTFKHPSSSIAFVFLPWILPLNMHLLFFVTFSQNLPSSSFLLIFNIFFSLFNILRHLFTPVFPLFLPRICNSFLDLSTSFLSFSHANSCSLIYSFSFYSEIFTSHFSTILWTHLTGMFSWSVGTSSCFFSLFKKIYFYIYKYIYL